MKRSIQYIFQCALLCISFVSTHASADGCSSLSKAKLADYLGAKGLINFMSVEVPACDALALGEDSVGFKLNATTQKTHGGLRSEVAFDFPFQENEVVNYSWQMQLPNGFKADYPQNRWWLVAQWHDQPDRRVGQTWDTFPHVPPPVAIWIEARNDDIGLAAVYAGDNKKSWTKIPLGEWVNVRVSIRWSTKQDGLLVLQVGNQPELAVKVSGQNMNNSYQHYLKLGQYRNPGIQQETVVYFKNVSIVKEPDTK